MTYGRRSQKESGRLVRLVRAFGIGLADEIADPRHKFFGPPVVKWVVNVFLRGAVRVEHPRGAIGRYHTSINAWKMGSKSAKLVPSLNG